MAITHIITSESVGKGHPDKICDQIADGILDHCLAQDPQAKVACEVFLTNRFVIVGGEIATSGYFDAIIPIWHVLKAIGYDETDFSITFNINNQSEELKAILQNNNRYNANDQATVYGYATNETANYMPLPINLAHALLQTIESKIKQIPNPSFLWDMKAQVSVDYGKWPHLQVQTMLVSLQHTQTTTQAMVKAFVNQVMDEVIERYQINNDFARIINPGGSFVKGGPISDSGLTGRKLMVDSYGGVGKHGGGAFSGKDPTKIDRSGAYFARYVAKNIVAAKLAQRCEVSLAYGIGINKPLHVTINPFGTNTIPLTNLYAAVYQTFDFSVDALMAKFCHVPITYQNLATYGHFGRTDLAGCWWEQTDQVVHLQNHVR